MSLVGSLEDLGLADILQIVSLSRKSGMLALRSDGGDGRIFLRDGLVQGAAIKGESESLRSLLVGGGFVEGEAFDRARQESEGGRDLVEAIQEQCGLPAERLESLRREHVERAVMRMFSWRSGEFSFEIREDLSGDDEELLLPSGLNTQYLAMEASRLRDENTRGPGASPGAAADDADAFLDADFEEPMFSGEEPAEAEAPAQGGEALEAAPAAGDASATEDAPAAADAVDALALAAARQADGPESGSAEPDGGVPSAEPDGGVPSAEPDGGAPFLAAEPVVEPEIAEASEIAVEAGAPSVETRVPVSVGAEEPDAPAAAPAAPAPATAEPVERAQPAASRRPPAASGRRQGAQLVAIDPDLSALEWLKSSVDGLFARVHIFQRTEIAIERIRQYLVRGVIPLVLVRDQGDQADAARGFVQRLRSLAPTMPLLALRPEGAGEEVSEELDGVVFRPGSPSSDPERWSVHEDLAERLRSDLSTRVQGARTDNARRRARNALARLKHVSDRLRDPSTQGEVLTLVLEFASETFSRVAMFMIRDDVAAGIAQLGLPPTGGPDDEGMRAIELDDDELPELFRQVIEQRGAVRSALGGPLDRRLAMRLGAAAPAEAYAAPIESGGCVVAIVYGDNLPEERPIRDTTALEIVLHEAGLALDRALLERALAERET